MGLHVFLWSAKITLLGRGRGAWFWKFAEPTTKTKHPVPALVRKLFHWASVTLDVFRMGCRYPLL